MKILIVRPSPAGEELENILNKIGILSWHFSLFYFSYSNSPNNLFRNIKKLYTSDVVVFFSKTAIYYTNLYLKKNNLSWPPTIEYYAIGQSTAFFLQPYVKKIIIPKFQENSESLLKTLCSNKLKNKKILLLQGENGRQLILTQLKKKGYNVSVIECYKKVFKCLNAHIEAKKWRSKKINTIIVTSGEIIRKLYYFFSEADRKEWLLKCKILVIGNRIEKIAKKLGWREIFVSSYANNSFLLKCIQNMSYEK